MNDHKIFTSSFVGISIISDLFIPLYVDIQNYILDRKLYRPIVMSNILSLHLTLYYLESNPNQDLLSTIRQVLNDKIIDYISVKDLSYFPPNGNKKTTYFSVEQSSLLREINDEIKSKFSDSGVKDNKYNFVPHITLFNVLDDSEFKNIEEELDKIIQRHIGFLHNKNICKGLCFYRVNSKYSPEIQIPVVWRSETFCFS